jgi:Ca2+-binding RTX toxin-like protein
MLGGAGDDALIGGRGSDEYYFDDGWGRDSIIDTATPNTKVHFEDLQAGPLNTDAVIVDLVSGPGPEARDASGANTISWDGSVIDTVSGGDGDDQITGNAVANRIVGGDGADTINGAEGDDSIYVTDGSVGDTVHCGAGEDTVSYDVLGIYWFLKDSIDSDCEHQVAYS